MLQFNTIVYTASAKFTSRLWWKLSIPFTTNIAPIPELASKENINLSKLDYLLKQTTNTVKKTRLEQNTNFEKFKKKLCSSPHIKSSVVTDIQKAENVNDLMEMTKTSLLSPEDNVTIKEAINTWVKENNIVPESHSSRNSSLNKQSIETTIDDTTYIELHSRYGIFSTNMMVKEIIKLARDKNRDLKVLRFLFDNIVTYNTTLKPRQCSSLLISMSILSYSDERLLGKICNDMQLQNQCSFIDQKLLSMIKCMAHMRYKNDAFLENVCININSATTCKKGIVFNIFFSLAMLGFQSEHLNKLIEIWLPQITIDAVGKKKWLIFIWSLVILNKANIECVSTVLKDTFVDKFNSTEQGFESNMLKLLNINAYAKYILKDYSGPFLRDTVIPITNKYTKQKATYVNALEDTLKNLLPSRDYFKMKVNTNMGFSLDAELYLDSESRPVVYETDVTDYKKVGIMIYDYYDLCLGSLEPLGLGKFYQRLLACRKYDVVNIPYQHIDIDDKLEKRLTYLKHQLWNKGR